MKHSGPGLLNVMQTRFPFVLVSAAAAGSELRKQRKENFSRRIFAFLFLDTTPRSRCGALSLSLSELRRREFSAEANKYVC